MESTSTGSLRLTLAGAGLRRLASVRGGFRSDWTLSKADSLTVQGDIYSSQYGETLTLPSLAPPYSTTFAILGPIAEETFWAAGHHSFATILRLSLQMYFDHTNYSDNTLFIDHESVFDIDFQHDFHLGESQEVVWGAGYRSIQDSNVSSFTVAVQPNHAQYNQFSAFVQDEISSPRQRLRLRSAPNSSTTLLPALNSNRTSGRSAISARTNPSGPPFRGRSNPCFDRRRPAVERRGCSSGSATVQ